MEQYGIIQQDDLYCGRGGSDKVYHLCLVKVEGGYITYCAFAKRGAMLTPQEVTAGVVDLEAAKKAYETKLKDKLKKYDRKPGISGKVFPFPVIGEGASSSEPVVAVTVAERKHSGFIPQGLNEISREDLERLIDDPEWGFQEKINFERLTVVHDGKGGVTGIQKQGFERPVPVEIAESLVKLGFQCKIDGEGSRDVLHAFDLLEVNGNSIRHKPTIERYEAMKVLLAGVEQSGVKIVPLYVTASDKRALLDRVVAENLEGICAKRLRAESTDARPASGGDWLKWKNVKTLSAIVLGRNGSKRSVKVGVYIDGNVSPDGVIHIGNPTVPANHDMPSEGDIVEVQYLTVVKGGLLVQPVYQGTRTDVDASECVEGQIRYN